MKPLNNARSCSLLLALSACLLCAPARADVLPPRDMAAAPGDQSACASKKAGDACSYMNAAGAIASGTCTASTCAAPGSGTTACLVCTPGTSQGCSAGQGRGPRTAHLAALGLLPLLLLGLRRLGRRAA